MDLFYILMNVGIYAYILPVIYFINLIIKDVKSGDKSNFLNYFTSILLLLINFGILSYFFITDNNNKDPLRNLYISLLIIPILTIWILILVSTLFYKIFGHPEKLVAFKQRLLEKNISKPIWEDIKRKILHLIFYIVLWIGILIASYFYLKVYPDNRDVIIENIWGYNSNNPTALFYIFQILSNPSKLPPISFGHQFFFIVFMITGYIFMVFEIVRLSKLFYFPTNKLFFRFLRKNEINNIASYFYFFLAMSFSAFVLPSLLTLIVAGVCLIGDGLASQFGMRWGKRKIRINPKKSWLGTAAGTIGSLIFSILLIGPIWGSITALIFMLTDVFTEKPVKISDNLINPFLITLIYFLLNLLAVPLPFPYFIIG